MKIKELVQKVFFLEILKGLFLTLKVFFRKPVTIRYPHEKRDIKPGFRGRHAFVRDPETGREKCVVCMKCATVCPSQCIKIRFEGEAGQQRILKEYKIEALRCVYCGYCAEVCPVNAIILTEHYEYASYKRDEFLFNRERLLKNWDEFIATKGEISYFNKFWRLDGIDMDRLPPAKRQQMPIKLNSSSLIEEKVEVPR